MTASAFSSSHNPLDALRREWESAIAPQPVPAGWAGYLPTPPPATLGQLLDEIQFASDANAHLLALVRLQHDGCEIAGRLLLQVMFPRMARLSRTGSARGYGEDRFSEAIGAMWSAIATYPLRRRERVAANLALDALNLLGRNRADASPEVPVDMQQATALEWEAGAEMSASEELVRVLSHAYADGVLSLEQASTLAARGLGPKVSLEELAADLDLSVSGLRHRIRSGLGLLADAEASVSAA